MLLRIVCGLCIASVLLPGIEGSWWSSDDDTTTVSPTEDAECDWSLDGLMGTDDTSSGVTYPAGTNYNVGQTGYPTGAGTSYGTAYVPQASGSGYVQQNGATGYVPQTSGNGYALNSDGTAYVPQNGGGGYTQNVYDKGGNPVSGAGYTLSGSYVTPQSQQRFFARQIAYMNQNDYVGLHPRYAIGSYVTVTNPDLQRSVVVKIVGRPKDLAVGRCLTLSQLAFQQIANLKDGVTHCIVAPTPT